MAPTYIPDLDPFQRAEAQAQKEALGQNPFLEMLEGVKGLNSPNGKWETPGEALNRQSLIGMGSAALTGMGEDYQAKKNDAIQKAVLGAMFGGGNPGLNANVWNPIQGAQNIFSVKGLYAGAAAEQAAKAKAIEDAAKEADKAAGRKAEMDRAIMANPESAQYWEKRGLWHPPGAETATTLPGTLAPSSQGSLPVEAPVATNNTLLTPSEQKASDEKKTKTDQEWDKILQEGYAKVRKHTDLYRKGMSAIAGAGNTGPWSGLGGFLSNQVSSFGGTPESVNLPSAKQIGNREAENLVGLELTKVAREGGESGSGGAVTVRNMQEFNFFIRNTINSLNPKDANVALMDFVDRTRKSEAGYLGYVAALRAEAAKNGINLNPADATLAYNKVTEDLPFDSEVPIVKELYANPKALQAKAIFDDLTPDKKALVLQRSKVNPGDKAGLVNMFLKMGGGPING